jgi:hypothetical protein
VVAEFVVDSRHEGADPALAIEDIDRRRHFAAAVAVEFHILGQQGFQRRHIAFLRGDDKGFEIAPFIRRRHLETWPRRLDMAAGAGRQLPAALLGTFQGFGDFPIANIEDIMQQETGAFQRCQAFQRIEQSDGQIIGQFGGGSG